MRLLIAVLLTIPLAAQEASTQQAQPAQPAAAEPRFSLEVGNRWSSEVKGNSDVYRSLVNLGDGPKVLGLDLSLRGPASGLFDKLDVRGDGWGGEPYSTARVRVERNRLFGFSAEEVNGRWFGEFLAPDTVQRFIGAAQPEEVVFVRGTTEAINLVAQTYGRKKLQVGDDVVISHMEHHFHISLFFEAVLFLKTLDKELPSRPVSHFITGRDHRFGSGSENGEKLTGVIGLECIHKGLRCILRRSKGFLLCP